MIEETIESISKATDVYNLHSMESRMSYNISLLEVKDINTSLLRNLVKEANTYGMQSLDEYIKLKLKFYLSLKEACINRLIDLNRNASSRSSTSSVAI